MSGALIAALGDALATDGLWFLITAATVAGLVRGFAGFGTAMIFLPVAGQVLGPFAAITVLVVMDLLGPLPNVPRAWRDAKRGDLAFLIAGLVLLTPLGVLVLTRISPETFRFSVSVLALILLVILISGYRYRGRVTRGLIFGTGAAGGFLGGAAGLPGPPVILFYMASPNPPAVIRANNLLYLLAADVVLLVIFGTRDLLRADAVILGLIVMIPYLLANIAGAAIFRPDSERMYRAVGYAVIAVSAIQGLPIFD